MSRLSDTLSTVIEAVKNHQLKASVQQKKSYDFRANFQYYSEGELVWVRNTARKRGVCPKLQRRFKGPYRVLERVTDVLYRLVLEEGGKESVVHFNRLKPFTASWTESADAPLPSRGVGRKDNLMPPDRRRVGVQLGASWVHHRHPGRLGPVEVAPPLHRADVDPALEGGGGAQRPVPSGVPSASEVTSSTDITASRPGPGENQGPGVVPVEGGRPVRQRRPPAWSRDYRMALE